MTSILVSAAVFAVIGNLDMRVHVGALISSVLIRYERVRRGRL